MWSQQVLDQLNQLTTATAKLKTELEHRYVGYILLGNGAGIVTVVTYVTNGTPSLLVTLLGFISIVAFGSGITGASVTLIVTYMNFHRRVTDAFHVADAIKKGSASDLTETLDRAKKIGDPDRLLGIAWVSSTAAFLIGLWVGIGALSLAIFRS